MTSGPAIKASVLGDHVPQHAIEKRELLFAKWKKCNVLHLRLKIMKFMDNICLSANFQLFESMNNFWRLLASILLPSPCKRFFFRLNPV